jgi:hypothetical protein
MLGQGRKEATYGYGTLLESPVRSAQPGNQFKMVKATKCKDFSWSKLKIELQNLDLKVLAVLCSCAGSRSILKMRTRIQEHRN